MVPSVCPFICLWFCLPEKKLLNVSIKSGHIFEKDQNGRFTFDFSGSDLSIVDHNSKNRQLKFLISSFKYVDFEHFRNNYLMVLMITGFSILFL